MNNLMPLKMSAPVLHLHRFAAVVNSLVDADADASCGLSRTHSQGVIMAKVGLGQTSPLSAKLLPRASHARLQVRYPKCCMRQQRTVPCNAACVSEGRIHSCAHDSQ